MAVSTDFVFSGIRTTIQGMCISIDTFFEICKTIINLVGPFTQTIISINLYWFRACSECQKSTDSANISFSWSREDKNKLLHEDADSDMYFCHKHLNNGSIRLCYKSHKYFKLKYVKRLLKFMGALLYILICQMSSGNNSVRKLIDDCDFKFNNMPWVSCWKFVYFLHQRCTRVTVPWMRHYDGWNYDDGVKGFWQLSILRTWRCWKS